MICLAPAPTSTSASARTTSAAQAPGAGIVPCCSCERRPASRVLTWPDARFPVCQECVSPQMAPVAEPLDLDDDLVLTSAVAAAESA